MLQPFLRIPALLMFSVAAMGFAADRRATLGFQNSGKSLGITPRMSMLAYVLVAPRPQGPGRESSTSRRLQPSVGSGDGRRCHCWNTASTAHSFSGGQIDHQPHDHPEVGPVHKGTPAQVFEYQFDNG